MKAWRIIVVLAAVAGFTAGSLSQDEIPGDVLRNDVITFRPAAAERSEYGVSASLGLYPILRKNSGSVYYPAQTLQFSLAIEHPLHLPNSLDVYSWDALVGFTDGNSNQVYDSFLSAMTQVENAMYWPQDAQGHPQVIDGATSFAGYFGQYLSRAYRTTFDHLDDPDITLTRGFPVKGYPRVGASVGTRIPANYPPVTHDIAMSNSLIVPASEAGTSRAIYSTRETVNGELDLITGQPLIREVDIELPFGGAVFRRIRTYTEAPSVGLSVHNWSDDGSYHRSRTPGWHGSGWMSNDALLFLFEAAYAQTMTTPDDLSPRCLFALDAHHSIPFIRQVSASPNGGGNAGDYNVDYVAPEWFDAILLHYGGEWDGPNKRWKTYPSEFKVILNKRSVTYTIKPYYEDVDPAEHFVPDVYEAENLFYAVSSQTGYGDPGQGVPYYGLVTEVQDRAGNRVVYSYADGHQPYEGLIYEFYWPHDGVTTLDDRRVEIRQRAWYKGMIDHIQLYAADSTEPDWTLLYTYRTFADKRDRLERWGFWDDESYPPALHSILVYEGDVYSDHPSAIHRDLILKCHELPDTSICDMDPLPGYDPSVTVVVDSSNLDNIVDGNSGASIDGAAFGQNNDMRLQNGSGGLSLIESPPFVELMLEPPSSVDQNTPWDVTCHARMIPVPLKDGFDNQFDYQDQAIGPAGEGEVGSGWTLLSENWTHQLTYSYADPPQYSVDGDAEGNMYLIADDYTAKAAGPVEIPSGSYDDYDAESMSYLLKVRSVTRDVHPEDGTPHDNEIERFWMYRYQDTEDPGSTKPERYGTWSTWSQWHRHSFDETPRRLSYRFSPRAMDTLTTPEILSSFAGGGSAITKNGYVNYLIGLDEYETVMSPSLEQVPLFRLADTSYLRWSEPYQLAGVQTDTASFGSDGDANKVAYPGSWRAFDSDIHGESDGNHSAFYTDLREDYLGSVESNCDGLTISQANLPRTGFLPEGTSIYASTDAAGNKRWYRMYRFIVTPEDEEAWRGMDSSGNYPSVGGNFERSDWPYLGPELVLPSDSGEPAPGVTHSIYHFPYRFSIADSEPYGDQHIGYGQIERTDPMWWVVVDEYPSLDAALTVNSSLTYAPMIGEDNWSEYVFTAAEDWTSRRVVALNPTGLVLSDRTWDEPGETYDPPAILEAYSYDEFMRRTMAFSRGWGSELSNRIAMSDSLSGRAYDETLNGLVQIYTYDNPIEEEYIDAVTGETATRYDVPLEVRSVWLNKGCETPTDPDIHGEVRVSDISYYRDAFEGMTVPPYLEGQLYAQNVYDLQGQPGLGTVDHRVEFWDASEVTTDDFDPDNPPVKWELHVGAAFKRSPTDPYVRPVSISFYNRKSQLVWQVSGSMAAILSGGGGQSSWNDDVNFNVTEGVDELFLNYRQYDEEGREYIAIDDIDVPRTYGQQDTLHFSREDLAYPAGGPQDSWPINEDANHGVLFLGDHVDVNEDPATQVASDRLADLDNTPNIDSFFSQLQEDLDLLDGIADQSADTQLDGGIHRQAQAPPLDLVTYREFSRFGPIKVVYPTGARDLYQYTLLNGYLEELKAMGVEFDGESWAFAGQGLFDSDFNGGQFIQQQQAIMDDLLASQFSGDPYDLSSGIFDTNRIQVIATIEPNYDSAGRISSMKVDDPNDAVLPIEQYVAFDGWGNITRSQDANGKIDRNTYDRFGRKHKTFVGSHDRHEIWGTVDLGQSNDDMFLVEKLHYGLGTNDANLVTHKWMFRQQSGTQYAGDWDEPSESNRYLDYGVGQDGEPLDPMGDIYQAGGSTPGMTSSGSLEEYGYDWRMRRVITRYRGLDEDQQNTGVYREQRVFLDNADRVRFVAIYDGVASQDAPHPDIDPGSQPGAQGMLPEPEEFFANGAAGNLLSLSETIYNGAGQTVETRSYDPDSPDPANPGYLVTQNYTDHANRPTWSRDAGQHITKSVYDAKGRVAWSSVWAGDVELSRTENVYGPNDTVDMTRTFERIDTSGMGANGGTENTLAVGQIDLRVTLAHQWYDSNKRLIARADFGSEEFTGNVGTYTSEYRPSAVPVIVLDMPEVPSGSGGTSGPDQTPRTLVGIEYPAEWLDADGRGKAQVTAYWYGPLGKKNASLRVLNAEAVNAQSTRVEYTIDRSEYNGYGQVEVEHKYGYSIEFPNSVDPQNPTLTPEDIEAQAEFLGGMHYSYELDGFDSDPFDGLPPPIFATDKVRRITPLTAGHVLTYNSTLRRFEVDWNGSTDPVRSTFLEYNAPVVEPGFTLPEGVLDQSVPFTFPIDSDDWGYLGVSNRPDLVKAVHMPDPVNGNTGSSTGYSFFYFYYADGLPAIRLDSRGIAIYYIYDERGNLTKLACDDRNLPLSAPAAQGGEGITNPDQLPANYIEYGYDAIDRLVLLTTGREQDGYSRIETESLIQYDAMGNMLAEYQSRDGTVNTATSPMVGYQWERVYAQADYSSGTLAARDNINRLEKLTYPARTGTYDGGAHLPRTLTFGYGLDGSISDLMNRVETITSEGGPASLPIHHVAEYQYSGIGRLESILLGTPAGEPQGSAEHILRDVRSFDPFGRVSNRRVSAFDGASNYRVVQNSDFGYDVGNRRIFERLTQQDTHSGLSRDNTHSAFYEHDLKGRLTGEHYGSLHANGFDGIDHAAVGSGTIDPLAMTYGLDLLNRRVGDGSSFGIETWVDKDRDGLITDLVPDPTDPNDPYNPELDELLKYSHQVDQRGGLEAIQDEYTLDAPEPVEQDVSGAVTGLHGRKVFYDWLGRPVLVRESDDTPIAAYRYDGFGRLAKRTTPWPDSDKSTVFRNEFYYYDGVRRIQEVFTDPMDATPPWKVAPGDMPLYEGGNAHRTEAEFIWSAASSQPFDTCHVQIDWWDREAWYIQDHATGTVRAFVDANGDMVRQQRIDAFGTLRSEDVFPIADTGLFAGFQQRIGHHGLFAERVDTDTLGMTLEVGGEAWYQSRSRWYVPELGRFLTSDPNATGVPTQQTLAMLGLVPAGPQRGGFSWKSHFEDCWDTNTAYSGNPVAAQDPTGLRLFLGGVNESVTRAGIGATLNRAAVGVLQNIRYQILRGLYQHNARLVEVANTINLEFSGFAGASFVGGGLSALRVADDAVGRGAFRAFSEANFRHNLIQLTAARLADIVDLDAHHIIPKAFAARITRLTDGLLDVHNPMLGQWLDRAAHRALHDRGYNQMWDALIREAETAGMYGDEAAEWLLNRAREISAQNGWVVVF